MSLLAALGIPPELSKSAVVRQDPDTGKWILWTKDGKRKLGTHDSAEAAYKQEYAIQKSMAKQASRWDKLLRAGKLSDASIGRILRSAETVPWRNNDYSGFIRPWIENGSRHVLHKIRGRDTLPAITTFRGNASRRPALDKTSVSDYAGGDPDKIRNRLGFIYGRTPESFLKIPLSDVLTYRRLGFGSDPMRKKWLRKTHALPKMTENPALLAHAEPNMWVKLREVEPGVVSPPAYNFSENKLYNAKLRTPELRHELGHWLQNLMSKRSPAQLNQRTMVDLAAANKIWPGFLRRNIGNENALMEFQAHALAARGEGAGAKRIREATARDTTLSPAIRRMQRAEGAPHAQSALEHLRRNYFNKTTFGDEARHDKAVSMLQHDRPQAQRRRREEREFWAEEDFDLPPAFRHQRVPQHRQKQASTASALRRAINATHTHPTPGQCAAGNYAKGEFSFHGIPIKIENPEGTTRKGYDKDGKETWSRVIAGASYGYFKGTKAIDGDAVDVFVGPDLDSDLVVAIDQYKGDKFDETKFVIGAKTQAQAEKIYLRNYPKGWKLGPVSTTTVPQLKGWLKTRGTTKKFEGQQLKEASLGRLLSLLSSPRIVSTMARNAPLSRRTFIAEQPRLASIATSGTHTPGRITHGRPDALPSPVVAALGGTYDRRAFLKRFLAMNTADPAVRNTTARFGTGAVNTARLGAEILS